MLWITFKLFVEKLQNKVYVFSCDNVLDLKCIYVSTYIYFFLVLHLYGMSREFCFHFHFLRLGGSGVEGMLYTSRRWRIRKNSWYKKLCLAGDKYHLLKLRPPCLFPSMHSLIFPVILTLLLHLLPCMVVSSSHLPCDTQRQFFCPCAGWALSLVITADSCFAFSKSEFMSSL